MERIAVLRYTKALFNLALEQNKVDEFNQAAIDILAVINSDDEFLAVINHLSIPAEQKMTTMKAIFGGKVPEDFMGLFDLLFRRGRQGELVGILEQFGKLYKEHKRIALAKLCSATELPQSKLDEIALTLGKKLDKTIEFELLVDPALIAGFRVEVDGYVFDSSIKNQVEQLKKQLITGGRHSALPVADVD